MKKWFFTCAMVAAALSVVDGQGPPQQPGPENKALEHFVGTWKMEGTMKPSPMGPGGAFTGTETCRMFDGGFHVVCDTEGSGAMGPMKGHMILAYDPTAKVYRYFAINNMAAPEMATGTRSGNTWTWKGEMDMGGKKLMSRFVIVETSPTVHTMTGSMSEDGKKWTTVMEAKTTKQ
jgi:hypothetical protein